MVGWRSKLDGLGRSPGSKVREREGEEVPPSRLTPTKSGSGVSLRWTLSWKANEAPCCVSQAQIESDCRSDDCYVHALETMGDEARKREGWTIDRRRS